MEQNKTTLGAMKTWPGYLSSYMVTDRDLSEYHTIPGNKVKALTLDAVNAALRKHFDKSKLVMVYGGDFEKGKTTNQTIKKDFNSSGS